ncbi:colanic acid biosynthesis glycosyl transferase WcaI [Bradyrhizobium sp. USDA 4449]
MVELVSEGDDRAQPSSIVAKNAGLGSMTLTKKIVLATQHYPPDQSTTAAIMCEIASALAIKHEVRVLSGSGSNSTCSPSGFGHPVVISIDNRMSPKSALIRRGVNEFLFACRMFFALAQQLRAGDVVISVTAPFVLPYAVVAAAWLKRARSIIIMHDLFPEVLIAAGIIKPNSLVVMAIRSANKLLFRLVSAVVTIGRDAERPLMRYPTMMQSKIKLIPNWCTLHPRHRPITAENVFRSPISTRFVVGLSGNLGFTHDPKIVFEAARLLLKESKIHFLLSGWGAGFEQLRLLQAEANLPNITLLERVEDAQLEELLAAADIWVIPYRKHVAGMSVPSRFYNLLAIGRPVILVSEPETEAALTLLENKVGLVVAPEDAPSLATAILTAWRSDDNLIGERAVELARKFSKESALAAYMRVVDELWDAAELQLN